MCKRMKCFGVLGLAGLLSVGGVGCGDSGGGADVVKREGEPDYIRTEGGAELDRAVEEAKATYRDLVAALEASAPGHSGFAVKKPYDTPDGGFEHIWIGEVTWDGERFHGVINNEPVDTDAVALGDRVQVTPDELSDWMYIDGDTIVGGYTVRVLHYQQSEEDQRAFEEATGLVVPPVDF